MAVIFWWYCRMKLPFFSTAVWWGDSMVLQYSGSILVVLHHGGTAVWRFIFFPVLQYGGTVVVVLQYGGVVLAILFWRYGIALWWFRYGGHTDVCGYILGGTAVWWNWFGGTAIWRYEFGGNAVWR